MRIPVKFLFKYVLLCFTIPLFILVYKFYSSLGDKESKSPLVDNNLDKLNMGANDKKLDKLVGLDLFKNSEDRFEDMYNFNTGIKSIVKSKNVKYPKHEIEIWGKASIAEYLWCHIFNANTSTYANGLLKHGEVQIGNLFFRYRSGPGIIQNTVPSNVKNLVLILNGKDELKIKFSKSWLDYLIHFKYLKNVALVILGDEKCENNWLLPYMKSRGGVVDIVFLIYDSPLIDNNEFYQWPLGVATYRGFPNFKTDQVQTDIKRQYLCNFLGTIYKNSSRDVLSRILKNKNNFDEKCFVLTRDQWVPSETYESAERYINVLIKSDITLSPVGQNTECYRIYEALSLGSVPIVEDVATPGQCDVTNNSPLRLLKEYEAPVIFIKNWNDLPGLLGTELTLTVQDQIERRKSILKWYENFKNKMKSKFVSLIRKHFFKEE